MDCRKGIAYCQSAHTTWLSIRGHGVLLLLLVVNVSIAVSLWSSGHVPAEAADESEHVVDVMFAAMSMPMHEVPFQAVRLRCGEGMLLTIVLVRATT